MTPLEHSRKASLEDSKTAHLRLNRKVYRKYNKNNLSNYSKETPLEVAYIDIHEDTPKLNAEYIVLLKSKRLSRIRQSRYKV